MSDKKVIVVGVLEDNKEEAVTLENAICELAEECSINVELKFTANTWESFMNKLESSNINTCILDIDLNNSSNINGMNVAERVDSMNKDIKIIFLTGHSGYMNSAFKVSAFDYLLKPLCKEDLRRTLVRLNNKFKTGNECLEVVAQEYIRIPYKDIIYIQYEDRRVKIITVDSVEILPSTFTFKSIISKLPSDQFIECCSGTCVNTNFIKRFNGVEIELSIPGMRNLKTEYGNIGNKMHASQSGVKRIRNFIKDIVRM